MNESQVYIQIWNTETGYYVQGVIDCSDEVVKQIERLEERGDMGEWRKL